MKPKLFDRILLAILLLFIVLMAVGLLVLCMRVVPLSEIQNTIAFLYADSISLIVVALVCVVLLAIALRLAFGGKAQKQPNATLVKATEIGGTYISLAALNTMVQKHCRANNRIRNCTSSVNAVRDGVTIALKLALMPDTDIPKLTQELQKSLKEYVETLSGIHVLQIGILVEDLSINPQSRVD